jgi:hypothetical protein
MTRAGNLAIPLLGMLFAAVFIATTWQLPAVSRVFPHTAAAMILVFGSILVMQELRQPTARTESVKSKAPLVYVMSVLFVVAFWLVGFPVASVLYLSVTQLLLKEHWARAGAVAVGMTLALYVMFHTLLGVQI